MPKRQGGRPGGISSTLYAKLCQLTETTRADLRAKDSADYFFAGLKTNTIVKAMFSDAKPFFEADAHELDGAIVAVLTKVVDDVMRDLTGEDAPRAQQVLLPGLELPEWLSVPPATGKGLHGWKSVPDCTPNQLKRVIDSRTAEIAKEETELAKLTILLETARRLKCDPDKPISTVLGHKPPRPPSGDEDHPPPPL